MLLLIGYTIRLHIWKGSDDQRAYHDHGYSFITIILKGGYTDITPDGNEHVKFLDVRFRKAEHKHKVLTDKGGCISLVFGARPRRKFGFYVPNRKKMLRPYRYFSRYGHHPCE